MKHVELRGLSLLDLPSGMRVVVGRGSVVVLRSHVNRARGDVVVCAHPLPIVVLVSLEVTSSVQV